MENVFWGFLIFSLGFVCGSVLIVLTFPVRNQIETEKEEEKVIAEDDNPFEEDPELRKQKEKYINFFS